MPDKPVTHGWDHRPFGFDTTPPGYWVYVTSNGTAWSGSTNYSVGQIVGDGTYNYQCIAATGPGTSNAIQPGDSNTVNVVNQNGNTITYGWMSFWAIYQCVFQGTWANEGTGLQAMRFRLSIGNPNVLNRTQPFNVSLMTLSDHQVEIQGSVTNGTYPVVSVIFYLPPSYWPENKLRLVASDDVGGVVPFTVRTDGSVWYGVA